MHQSHLSRQSNMELLRIIAMFFVLVLHANFFSLGSPSWEELSSGSLESISRVFVQAVAIIAVNLFILLSGYFSIQIKRKSVFNFLYCCFFYAVVGYLLSSLFGITPPLYTDVKPLLSAFFFLSLSENWFVMAYLGLLLFSPMLNKFVEHSSQKELAMFIVCVTAFQAYFNNLWLVSCEFRAGYSMLSFMNIYCIGRFIRLYRHPLFSFSRKQDLWVWLIFVVGIVLNAFFNKCISGRFDAFAYNNPLVIGASVFFFLFFTKISFTSTCINRMAASAFSVFLLHCNIHLVGAFKKVNQELYAISVGYVFFFLIAVYAFSVLIDQARIYSFKAFQKYI